MPRLPVVGSDGDAWGNLLNEFLRVAHREDGTLKTTPQAVNVKDYGATGSGTVDDTLAIRSALSASLNGTNKVLYFPAGSYLVTGKLTVDVQTPISIVGDGWCSNILWAFNGNLFEWSTGIVCRECTVRDLKITSSSVAKSTTSAAISCKGGVEKSLFDNLLVFPAAAYKPGTGIHFTGVCDSTTIRDCQLWLIKGVGIRIGSGSEIRIQGGRVIGDNSRTDGSIGVQITGNCGGVHIVSTDLISLNDGVCIDNSSGAGSNREIFLTHATLDSCGRGLSVKDNSYVSLAGCWAASCNSDNIHVEAGLTSPLLNISGGSIFNAGSGGGDTTVGRNGITVNSGSFVLNGVSVRNNLGRGIWVPNTTVKDYAITGCRVVDNGQGAKLTGSNYLLANNVFTRNTTAHELLGTGYLNNGNLVS